MCVLGKQGKLHCGNLFILKLSLFKGKELFFEFCLEHRLSPREFSFTILVHLQVKHNLISIVLPED